MINHSMGTGTTTQFYRNLWTIHELDLCKKISILLKIFLLAGFFLGSAIPTNGFAQIQDADTNTNEKFMKNTSHLDTQDAAATIASNETLSPTLSLDDLDTLLEPEEKIPEPKENAHVVSKKLLEEKTLSISGFMTVLFTLLHVPPAKGLTSVYEFYHTSAPSFGLGGINVYLDANPHPWFRGFVELRFYSLLSNIEIGHSDILFGSIDTITLPDMSRLEVVTQPPAHFDEASNESFVGGFNLERAYIEFKPKDSFHISLGQFLTPYGIFNLDHGDLVVSSVRYPFLTAASIIPNKMLGLQISGHVYPGNWQLDYYGYIGNQNTIFQLAYNFDLYAEIAGGGRLALTPPFFCPFFESTFGISFYYGTETNILGLYRETSPSGEVLTTDWLIFDAILDRVLALDWKVQFKKLIFQSEFMINFAVLRDPELFYQKYPSKTYHEYGVYGQLEYIIKDQLKPYLRVEYIVYTDEVATVPKPLINTLGMNYRPFPFFVCKFDVSYIHLKQAAMHWDPQMYYTSYWSFAFSSSLAF